jgi:hypothetical protein
MRSGIVLVLRPVLGDLRVVPVIGSRVEILLGLECNQYTLFCLGRKNGSLLTLYFTLFDLACASPRIMSDTGFQAQKSQRKSQAKIHSRGLEPVD